MYRECASLWPRHLLLRPRDAVRNFLFQWGFVFCHGPRQSSLQFSADRPAKFQLRPNARIRLLSDFATMISGAIQYSELVITVSPSRLFPGMGVTAPSMMPGI